MMQYSGKGAHFNYQAIESISTSLRLKITKSASFGSTRDCKYKESQDFWIKTLDGAFSDQNSNDIRH